MAYTYASLVPSLVMMAAACSAFDPDSLRESLIFLVTGRVSSPL
jgi:hypothetical protein